LGRAEGAKIPNRREDGDDENNEKDDSFAGVKSWHI